MMPVRPNAGATAKIRPYDDSSAIFTMAKKFVTQNLKSLRCQFGNKYDGN
jgi:hypothetical protein